MKMRRFIIGVLAILIAFSAGQVGAIEEVNKEMKFRQHVWFDGGTTGIVDDQRRVFYVVKADAAIYSNAFADLKPFSDGVPRLYTDIDSALAQCVANRGDIIYVLPGHTETLAAAQSLDKAGVQIIGLGRPYPEITVNGAIDGITVDAADVTLQGIEFPAPGTDAQTSCVTVKDAGDNFVMKDCLIHGSDTGDNIIDCLVIEDSADYLTFDNVTILNNVVAVNSFLTFEGNTTGTTIKNCLWWGDMDGAGIVDDAAASGIDMLTIENCRIGVIGTAQEAATLDQNPEGWALDNLWAGTNTTIANNANLGNLMREHKNYVLEVADGSVQSTPIIPARDTE
jgi:hypothetical protein